jgi:acetoin utilization deacetylase AcuC-like enzyme
MDIFISDQHQQHSPKYEFYRGERVPCFECPDRLNIVRAAIEETPHQLKNTNKDSRQFLERVHNANYLRFLETAWSQWLAIDSENASVQPFPSAWPVRTLRSDIEPENFVAKLGLYSMDNGSPMVEGTWAAAKAGADATVSAALHLQTLIENDSSSGVFCATRPPGHHAGTDFMGGYCFVNNAAVAAEVLREQGHAKVAILDVDYHHGNGTQSIFYERADVLFTSLHGDPKTEYPFYLGHADERGEGDGRGFNFNYPLAAGSSASLWFAALEKASAEIKQHSGTALVVSLGLDTYSGDPISNFELETSDFKLLGKKIKQIGLPTLFILEGGYATDELGLNTVQVIDGFEQN